jgi:processing peptidase subunit alpha
MVVAGTGITHHDLVKLVEEHFGDLRIPPKAPDTPLLRSVPTHLLSTSASSSSPLHKTLTTAATSFLNPKPIAEPTYYELASAKARYTGGQMFLHRPEEQFNHVYVAFEGVSIHDDDIYTLAVIQMLLGGGGSFSAGKLDPHIPGLILTCSDAICSGGPGKGMYSRLYTHVLNHHPAIDHCSSLHHIYTDSSLFGIVGTSYPSLRPNDLLPTLVHQLSLLLYNPVSERELQRAKNQLMSSLVMALESRAVEVEDLGRQVLVHGRRVPVTEMCWKIEAITPADLMRVANRVFGNIAQGEPTLLVMGREDIPGWKATMQQYGVGRIV